VVWRDGNSPVGEALAVLRRGGVLIYPTETVYGLGTALSAGEGGVERVRAAKGAPAGRPYLQLVADAASAFALWSRVPASAHQLAALHWPGPLTMIGPAGPGLPASLLGSANVQDEVVPTVSVRVPGDDRLRALLRALGEPLLSTSANRSGQPAPASFDAVTTQNLAADLAIDAGDCSSGMPSTLVSLLQEPPRVLRQGSVVLGEAV